MSDKLVWHYPDGCNLKYIDYHADDVKDTITQLQIETMLERTVSMFEWKNLPDTIPQEDLELLIQTWGYATIIKNEDKLFAVRGFAGGIRNYNYRPARVIVSNPYLMLSSKEYNIYYGEGADVKSPLSTNQVDCSAVVICNDPLYKGIVPLCQLYASDLTETKITKRILTINIRAMYIAVAGDDDTKKDLDELFESLEKGKIKSVKAEGMLGDGAMKNITTLPLVDRGFQALTDLIENEQYIKASWFNDLGLQANYNMKRESINSNESQLNKDAVLPFVDTMLRQRKLACERINSLFGTNISVDFSSAWGYTRTTIEQAIDAIDPASETKVGDEDEINEPTNQVDENEPNQVGG